MITFIPLFLESLSVKQHYGTHSSYATRNRSIFINKSMCVAFGYMTSIYFDVSNRRENKFNLIGYFNVNNTLLFNSKIVNSKRVFFVKNCKTELFIQQMIIRLNKKVDRIILF